LRTMDRVLKEKGFVRLARAASEQLSYALEHKEVDCDDVTIIYASIAEIMDLPLFAVVLPSHAFLRWQLNNGNSFNWEALLHGEPETDEVTLKGYPVSKYSVENGSYFKSLTRRELTGYCYYKISNSWNAKIYVANKQLSPNFREFALKSIENNTKSIEFNAKVPQMYLNRGHTLSILGDLKGSLRDYEEAKKLDPHDPVTYLLIANISIEESKSSNDVGACYQKAIDNTNQVIDLKDQGIHVDDRIMFWNYDLRCKIWDKKGELDQHAKDQKMKEFYHQKVIEYMRMINDYNRNQRGG
ncbi:MAG: hypothetical protein U9O94_03045, partial [Nanoarchaeota archaeon]|nr:hypothetical protein [Nanoarchaeota archaeon]